MISPVQKFFENFENLKFDPFESKDVALDDFNDPDKNFHNNIHAIDIQCYFASGLSLSEILHINFEIFSMIHLNITNAKENFEKLKNFLSQAGSFFKVLCLTETFFDDRNSESFFYQLPKETAIHQHRSPSHKNGRRKGHKHVHP